MLWDASAINGFSLQAKDGDLGSVSDLLFDKDRWSLRWLVVETGIWPLDRKLDLPLSAVGSPDFVTRAFKSEETINELGANSSADEHASRENDPQLMSVKSLVGYAVVATNGAIGHVENVLVDEQDLAIRFLTVHTADWWPGVKVLVAPSSITSVDADQRRVTLDLDSETVKAAPVFDATTTLDGVADAKFLTYFGIRWVES